MPSMMTSDSSMEGSMDILNWLDADTCMKIFLCFDDLADLLRASAVSRSWHSFVSVWAGPNELLCSCYQVIENGICRQLCLRMFPPLLRLDRVIQVDHDLSSPEGVGPSRYMELALDRDHRVFASLAHACTSSTIVHCLSEALSASSTDNFPEESVHNTLEPRVKIGRRASYWSSKGQSNPAVPETLMYKLCSKICVITQINIRPFKAYFQLGSPIYSARSVRIRIGYPKDIKDNIGNVLMCEKCPEPADDKIVWTYTSEAFPMAQESQLQEFKLPEPVLCIGGFLQVELMGRVQRQEMDGLFYICVAHFQVLGRPLSPAFDVDILEPSGKFLLKYFPHMDIVDYGSDLAEDGASLDSSSYHQHVTGLVDLAHILNMLRGRGGNIEYEWEDELEESDEEVVE